MKSSSMPDSVWRNRPDFTCSTCNRWVFIHRKTAKVWLKDHPVAGRGHKVVSHPCGEGFITAGPTTPDA